MKTLLRCDAMDEILSSRIDTCMSDNFYLPDILKFGFTGFDNMTNKELEEVFFNEFNKTIKIIN